MAPSFERSLPAGMSFVIVMSSVLGKNSLNLGQDPRLRPAPGMVISKPLSNIRGVR